MFTKKNTTDAVSRECKSERIKEIHKRISAIKSNEEIGVKYMQAWEEKLLDRQEARREGIEEGREIGKAEGEARVNALYEKLVKAKRIDDIVKAADDKEYREELYKEFGL